MPTCNHLARIKAVKPAARHECEECVKNGTTWVHLRTCQRCGSTLCSDNSPRRHASRHYDETAHPVMASAEPGERWMYCHLDDAFVDY